MNAAPLTATPPTPLNLIGTPYRLHGATPGGFDCWGLVLYVRREFYNLATPVDLPASHAPRAVMAAIARSRRLPRWRQVSAPMPGDVVALSCSSLQPLHHVGVAVPDGVLHAYLGEARAGGSVVLTPWARLTLHFPAVEYWRHV